jgi:hypothetical protein
MTIAEIEYTLEQKLQILNSNVYGNLLTEEILLQFDNIVDRFIDAHLYPKQVGSLKGIDETQLTIDNLRFIKEINVPLSRTTTTYNDSVFSLLTLPNYRNLINDSSEVTICGVTKLVGNRLIGDEELKENIEANPFLKSKSSSPLSRISGNNYYIIDGVSLNIETVNIDYYRKPVRLYDEYIENSNPNFDFVDFPRNCIDFLVDLLKNRFLETLQSERLQGSVQEINNFGTLS